MLIDVNPMFSHFVFPADGVEAKSWTDGFHLARWGPCLREISAIKFTGGVARSPSVHKMKPQMTRQKGMEVDRAG